MKERIGVGIVGCGYWGPNLLRNLRGLADCEAKVICDLDIKRLNHLQGLYPGIELCTDFEEIVARPDLDALVIATSAKSHYAMAKQSLSAGKHTFIEKPMATSAAECDELIRLAAARELTLMVGHTFLYSAPVRRIKEIIDSGEIGELRYISARRLNLGLFQRNINVTWDLAPHDISIILYVTGMVPQTVNCQGNSHVTKGVEDVTNLCMTFNKGVFATIHNSWLDPRKVREMTIVGSKRMIVYDDVQPLEKIRIYDVRVETPSHYDTFAEFHFSYHYGDSHIPFIKQEEPLKVECQHFLDCIRSGQRPLTDGAHGAEVVRILDAASQSLKQNGGLVAVESSTMPAAITPAAKPGRIAA
ncbi:MAG TPA: Gfo/Idh/MocA family oxidoreductase [Candidatus Limnocylindria bacterium]|nr:Gfo/Idh/MocA family oxidoreductase [Candidatus Limnocylindria bacterium]